MHVRSIIAALAFIATAHAEVRLPAIISDHMVLQRATHATIWGWADEGEKVTVALAGKSAATTAGENKKWSVQLELPQAGGPHELSVAGKNELTVRDVLIGEVWLCSGQSNMGWTVKQSNDADAEIAAANFPKVRQYKVPLATADTPQEDAAGKWELTTPETVPNFTAVGYFFSRHLHRELGVTVGFINSSWGGTPAEAWTSRAALDAEPKLKPLLVRWDGQVKTFDREKAKAAHEKAVAAHKEAAAKAKAEGKPAPRAPQYIEAPRSQHRPANLYNAMIAPLLPFHLRGAIWYQGESNVPRAEEYRTLFPAMIRNWRADFAQGDFSFHFVQLAPYRYNRSQPERDPTECAQLWDAQLFTLRSVPKTGMAVTTDIGNVNDIHPKNKQEVGRRLALWALAKDYGKKNVVFSGPLYRAMKIEGDAVRLSFEHAAGLRARDGQALSHFTIAGEDKKFAAAEATIDGESIVVRSAAVKKPVSVRFAWIQDAEPNLVNGACLPASPFRTDDWSFVPLVEVSPR